MQKLYTVKMIADLLQRHENTVRRWIDEGAVPTSKIGAGLYVTEHDLRRLLKAGRAHVAAARTR